MTDRSLTTAERPLSAFEAAVWDLDGTLVRLPVDWDAVTRDVASVFEAAGIDATGADLWQLLERSGDAGLRTEVERTIADHERREASSADRLPSADAVGRFEAEGVCSLNCEDACRVALETHGLSPYVDAIVGRDSLDVWKPDPAPLLETVRRLDADAEQTVFVGDSERDEVTARRAGIEFRYVRDLEIDPAGRNEG
ncbi:HAD family hydrolase [Halobellus clavatus]|jgi:phosphoglycolate phosphatase|uniref:Phosphoglycolate phosphatase n=1 Tax=Halobellus clavatus TaxID=660517 RepID=A0A1H3F211_9EURY|nr:HAD hydrolase-like protein [Halobellus clavatus]SDX84905.1 phosphoglycolate phosphatase [Halobellus clavatus]